MEIRTAYHKRLKEIQDEIMVMGSAVEQAIGLSMEALRSRDLTLARRVMAEDDYINEKRFEIEGKCVSLMATQHPVASDLRIIIAVLNIISELERIGDYAFGTARIAITIGDEPPLKPLVDLPRMAGKTIDMLHRSLVAFISLDAEAAKQIIREDDEIDNLNEQVYRELVLFMVSDPKTITRATRLMWVSHNLERSADRVTNICERIVFQVTGKMEELGSSKF